MFRKGKLELLRVTPCTADGIAAELEFQAEEVEVDQRHLLRSVRHRGYRVRIIPARCQRCGFAFHADKLDKPGKCPRCRQTWVSPPLIRLESGGLS